MKKLLIGFGFIALVALIGCFSWATQDGGLVSDVIVPQQLATIDGAEVVVGGNEVCPKPPMVFVFAPPPQQQCLKIGRTASTVGMMIWPKNNALNAIYETWKVGAWDASDEALEFTRPDGTRVELGAVRQPRFGDWLRIIRS